jgi:hypothetical protein
MAEITLTELLAGRATRIKNRDYFPTAAYVEPFLERAQRLTSEFRIQVQLPTQITYTANGDINTEDITYNRVLIEAILPDEYKFNDDPHKAVLGMVYGIDVRKPVVKFFKGKERMSCTNLCVFSPQLLACQDLESETAVDYKPFERIIEQTDDTASWMKKLIETDFNCATQNVNESLGRWIRNCINMSFDNHYGKAKLAVSTPIDAYKSLFEKEDSDYYAGVDSGDISMYQVYNAFTQELTDGMKKDPFNIFEKTLLLKDILDI